jgi:hypothetical protein
LRSATRRRSKERTGGEVFCRKEKQPTTNHMVTKTYTIKGKSILDPVCNFVRQYNQSAYETNYTGGFLRVNEEYSYLNRSDIMVCIRVDTSQAEDGIIIIELISGGATGHLLTGSIFARGRSRIRDFGKELQEFCIAQRIEWDSE